MKTAIRTCGAAAALVLLAACGTFVQTTSGESYLAKANSSGVTLSDELRAAAAVEPLIEFPARIGVARIENGQLTDIPAGEWDALSSELDNAPGAKNEIIPVSLFVIDLAASYSDPVAPDADRSKARRSIIERLRTGGARQHLDAVILYEVHGQTASRQTSLALADWTLIGAYIAPGRRASAVGNATALMFDVRNGYPYGGADATVEKDKLAPAIFASDRARDLLKETQSAAVAGLAPKLADLVTTLELEMAGKRASSIRAR